MAESVADLKSLYNVEATLEYTSRNSFVRELDAFVDRTCLDDPFLQDHTVLVTRFPPQILDSPAIPRNGRITYFPESQILIVTMVQTPHEIVACDMGYFLRKKVDQMNCFEELISTGGAIRELQGLNKAPDGSWGPRGAGYVTCVLEAGASQSLRQLANDAGLWLENEASRVTQMVTVKIYPRRREIIFTVWIRTAAGRAEKDDEIHVELRENRPMVRDNRCLRLSFERLFERPPTRGTREKDLIFSARELGSIARKVWEEIGLIPST